MTKMTNEEIKKGLEKCTGVSFDGCPYNDNYTTCADRLKSDVRMQNSNFGKIYV